MSFRLPTLLFKTSYSSMITCPVYGSHGITLMLVLLHGGGTATFVPFTNVTTFVSEIELYRSKVAMVQFEDVMVGGNEAVGAAIGTVVGTLVGILVGMVIGAVVGTLVGLLVGIAVGFEVGILVGLVVGALEGLSLNQSHSLI